jgi:hypothetical protein
MRLLITLVSALVTVLVTTSAQAFCGFYVARADTSLFNRASQVVLVRDEDKTVITMANDFEGDAEDFAVVIPVPTMIEGEQINVGDRAVIEHLDAYTSPRLVEYHDGDPCVVYERLEMSSNDAAFPSASKQLKRSARSRGVTIEAQYTVGEYDILILSATQSDGLIQWLVENDYRIPSGAERVVDSYLKQDMRFFVAKVNLEEQSKLGFQYLRPLQVAYESNRFMLPIRPRAVSRQPTTVRSSYQATSPCRNLSRMNLPTSIALCSIVKPKPKTNALCSLNTRGTWVGVTRVPPTR